MLYEERLRTLQLSSLEKRRPTFTAASKLPIVTVIS